MAENRSTSQSEPADSGGFITEGREREASAELPESARKPEPTRAFFEETLRKRFHQVGNAWHARDSGNPVMFVDEADRIRTDRNDPRAVSGMLDLAMSKGWTSVNVNGARAFKSELWLQASVRGMQVQGYEPTELDRKVLQERLSERAREASWSQNRGPNDAPAATAKTVDDPAILLSHVERERLETLRKTMRSHGASPDVIDRAVSATQARFRKDRFYVGIVRSTGFSHYRDDPKEEKSPYVVLDTPIGERKIWGADLPRALDQADARPGKPITLEFKGARDVEVDVPVRDPKTGERIGTEKKSVRRNEWLAQGLEKLDPNQRAEALKKAQSTVRLEQHGDRGSSRQVNGGRIRRPAPTPTHDHDLQRTI
ncbi:MAG: LPD7 domain-containing protein [Lautropia sp.]